MATQRKVITVSVSTSVTNFNDALKDAIDAALPSAEDWSIVYVESRPAGSAKDAYTIWAQRTV